MEAFPCGVHARLPSRPYLHTYEGRRAVSLPARARGSSVAPSPEHRLLLYVTSHARFVRLAPGHLTATRGHGGTHQDDDAMDGAGVLCLGSWPFCYNHDGGGHDIRDPVLKIISRRAPQPLALPIEHSSSITLSGWPNRRLTPLPSFEDFMDQSILKNGFLGDTMWRMFGTPSSSTYLDILPHFVDTQCLLRRGSVNSKIDFTMFRFNSSKVVQPVGRVIRENSWEAYMGFPMEQTVPNTCTLVACTVCVEAMHRLEYETLHGPGTFPCRSASPRKLRRACLRDKILIPKKGAKVESVLKKLKEIGGVRTTNAPPPAPFLLPVSSWQIHHTPTQQLLATVLDRGPCIGSIWICPWWPFFDASISDDFVYRGCGRSEVDMQLSALIYGTDAVGRHCIVCYKYRICLEEDSKEEDDDKEEQDDDKEGDAVGKVMHVLVMDNHLATGPPRWVDYEEIIDICTINIERIEPPIHMGGRQLTYPRSRCYS